MNRDYSVKSTGVIILVLMLTLETASAVTVAYYRFEEGLGTSMIDTTDASVDGAHSAAYSADVFGNSIPNTMAGNFFSLEFSGAEEANVTAQSFIFHDAFGGATLEFWIKIPTQSHSSIFWTRDGDLDRNRFNISINPGGSLQLDYREPGGALHNLGAASVPVDVWNHIAITRTIDSPTSHTYRYYVNSKLDNTVVDNNPVLPDSTIWSLSGRTGFELDGLIDEIRFSDTVLDVDEFLSSAPSADLAVSVTDGLDVVVPGDPVSYMIEVINAGPLDVLQAQVADVLPAELSQASWMCMPMNGAVCTANQSGNLSDMVDLPVGSSANYVLTATVDDQFSGIISYSVSVTPPAGLVDPDTNNNMATDTTATDGLFEDGFEEPLLLLRQWLDSVSSSD